MNKVNDIKRWCHSKDPIKRKIYYAWDNMHKRVLTCPWYTNVTICDRWYRASQFAIDVMSIPGFDEMVKNPSNYCLDKDMLIANNTEYCPEACSWITRAESSSDAYHRPGGMGSYTAKVKAHVFNGKPFYAVSPEGTICRWSSASTFEHYNGLTHGAMSYVLKVSHKISKLPKYHGWIFYYEEDLPDIYKENNNELYSQSMLQMQWPSCDVSEI